MTSPAGQTTLDRAERPILWNLLRWIGGIGIAGIAVTRCVVTFAPRVVFDIDPAVDPLPLPGLGPAGSLLLDVGLLAACGCVLVGEALSRRGIDWWLVGLALTPAAVVAWHGLGDAADLWRGSTWVAAVTGCAAVAHLARDPSLRLVLLALLASILVPIAVRGGTQMSVSVLGWSMRGPEHADLIREFESGRDAFFADRGWTPDSPAARIYERRLRQPDPRGWFPTVNLFASLMAFGAVLLTGLGIGALRQRAWTWAAATGLAAAVAAGAMLLAGSKGAVLAAAMGFGLLIVPMVAPLRRYGGALAIALVAAALLGIAVRGAVLPEAWLGERSLLFRWHYLIGSARVISDHGLLGVGPDGFQAAYTAVRVPRSPEEIRSAHNVFADWGAGLGLAGAAWAALLLILTWRAGRRAMALDADDRSTPMRAPLAAAAAVAVGGLMPALVVEAANLGGLGTQLARALGVLGFVAAAAGLSAVLGGLREGSVNAALGAAAVVLVVHGQIEMTFFDPGSVAWVMCVVGLAGGAAAPPKRERAGAVVGAALLIAAGSLSVSSARAYAAQRVMIESARGIHAATEAPEWEAHWRQIASDSLLGAYDDLPTDAGLLEEAARQRAIAAGLSDEHSAHILLGKAVALADQAVAEHGKASSIFLAADLWRVKALTTDDAEDWEAAIERARRLTAVDPHGVAPWRRLGDVMWAAGRRNQAAEAYRRALENDANFELDPLKQLAESERERIRERIEEKRGAMPQSAASPAGRGRLRRKGG